MRGTRCPKATSVTASWDELTTAGFPTSSWGWGHPFFPVTSLVRPKAWSPNCADGIVRKATGWDYWRDSLKAGYQAEMRMTKQMMQPDSIPDELHHSEDD